MTEALVATFGELTSRLPAPGSEAKPPTPDLEQASFAIAMAQFGCKSRFITEAEPGPVVEASLDELRRLGVDVFLGSKIVDWSRALTGVTSLFISGTTPGISPSAAEMALQALTSAHNSGAQTVCDLNFRSDLWQWGKCAAEVMPELIKACDVCIANEVDCENALSIRVDIEVESGEMVREKYSELTERVLATYPNLKMIAVKFRESSGPSQVALSACLHTRSEFLVSKRYSVPNTANPGGLAVSFSAGLIYGLAHLNSPAEALNFAVAASSLKDSNPEPLAG